jgi:hypothetical protein
MELIILIAAIVITTIVAITEFRSYQMRPSHPPAQHSQQTDSDLFR